MSPKQTRLYSLLVGVAAVLLLAGLGFAHASNLQACKADGGRYSWGDSSCTIPAASGVPAAKFGKANPSS